MKTLVLPLALLSIVHLCAQGPLQPPSLTPAPTMKSLDQIEARTAIPKSPSMPIAGPHFAITQPGSYYLTGNIEVASGDGILISSSNVTLDLNGFALISTTVTPAAGSAIKLGSDLRSIEIKNGRVSGGAVRTPGTPATFANFGWLNGIGPSSGNSGCHFSQLSVDRCRGGGIVVSGTIILDSITSTSNGSFGFYSFGGSARNCVAADNGSYGIYVEEGFISDSIAKGNGAAGINSDYGSVTNCIASGNNGNGISAFRGAVATCVAASNRGTGIYAEFGSVVNSRASSNFRSGISVGEGVAAQCVATLNSTDPATVDKQIDVNAGGQRNACVPASE
jgi:hypothetical protein